MPAPTYTPGERVLVRDRAWRIRTARAISDSAALVELDSLEGDASLTVCTPPDEIELLPSTQVPFARAAVASFAQWAAQHAVLASTMVRDADVLSGARFGRVNVEAYQLAPALRVLRKPRPSLLVADDVGLGKTIEAGLLMLELIARRRAERILIVAPPGLLAQWQTELRTKFALEFTLIENAAGLAREQTALPAGVNPWDALPRVLTSTDYIKKETVRRRALLKRWDLVIADEAHSLAEAGTDKNPYRTQRTRLGEALRDAARGLVLLTATPHNGHAHSFRSLLELVEPSLATLAGSPEDRIRRIEQARIRRLKSQITRRTADGAEASVFPPRTVQGVPVEVDDRWSEVFHKVSNYCSRTARSASDSDDAELITFAMQILKKRAMSSRAAFEATVRNRLDALKKKDAEPKPERAEVREFQADLPMSESAAERTALRILRAAVPADEKRRKAEVSALNSIQKLLKALPSGDPKLDRLVAELGAIVGADPAAKVIVFTEYVDTLESLRSALEASTSLRGRSVELRGGMSPRQRVRVQDRFESAEVNILLATDAASEGLNLQRRCHRIFHVELPWNPNRLEQRNGRVDRYGQTQPPQIRYLFYPSSAEEDVLHRLVERIEGMQKDRISTPDILGVLEGADILGSRLVELDGESEDLDARKRELVKVFEDRTAEFVRDVQPLIAGRSDSGAELAGILNQLHRAEPLLPDDAALEITVKALLGGAAVRPTEVEGVVRIDVPVRFQGSRVSPSYSRATFLRSVAVRFPAADVEFVTAAHPLVQALAADARRQLLHVYPGDRGLPPRRLAVRRVPSGQALSVVFTFFASLEGDEGVLAEQVLAVRVGLGGETIEHGDSAERWLAPTTEPGEAPFDLVEREVAPKFEALAASASRVATELWLTRANALRGARSAHAARIRAELGSDLADRLAEIDAQERRARELVEPAGQGLFFPRSTAAMPSLDARREAARTFAEARRAEAERFASVRDPAPPRPLGALVLVPEGAR